MQSLFHPFLSGCAFTFALIVATPSHAENQTKEATSTINKVNVYQNRAQVNRNANVEIKPGITDVVLKGLTTNLDINTIQVDGKGQFILMSVKFQKDFLNKNISSDKARNIQSQIDVLKLSNKKLRGENQVLIEEKELLLSNQLIGGAKNGLTALELERNATYFRARRTNLDQLYIANDTKVKENNQKVSDLKKQLNEINRNRNEASGSIVVSVSSKIAQKIKLDFNYMVFNAGWTPYYDVRAADGSEKIKLNYKAKIRQNTGIDWGNVFISVSTGNPAQGGNRPDLFTWNITAKEPYLYKAEKKKRGSYAKAYNAAPASKSKDKFYSKSDNLDKGSKAGSAADYTSVKESDLAVTFDISLKQTIPSNNKKYTVDIQNFDINTAYSHSAVPKLDQDAFLIANLTKYENLNLISGSANVFYDGAFVGNSYLNLKNTSDTLQVSLGRDKKVIVTREKIKNYCKSRTIGTNIKKTTGYEITVRNTKQKTVKLTLEDHVPISNNSTVEVSVLEMSGGKMNDTTKKVTWELELKPGETKKVYLKFEVKFPKNSFITNL